MSGKCVMCPLHKESKVNLVSGVGPQPSSILFIGDALSEADEDNGSPFSGPAGELFDSLLAQAGIDRSQVRVTNIVRCRPTDKNKFYTDRRGRTHYNNKPLTPEEIYVCAPSYLEKEIEETKPSVIVPVGSIALHYLEGEYNVAQYTSNPDGSYVPTLEKSKGRLPLITKTRGVETWNKRYNCKQIPIVHPQSLLRGSKLVNTTVEDLRRIKTAGITKDQAVKVEGNYVLVDTWEMVEWVLQRLSEVPEFTYDVETTGFDWMRDKLVCIGFSWKVGTGVSIRWRDEKGEIIWTSEQQKIIVDRLNQIFESPFVLKIAQNAKFDIHMLMGIGIKYPSPSFDTMLAHHMIDSDTDHGLKSLAWIYCPDMAGYEKEMEDVFSNISVKDKTFMDIPWPILGKYNAMDCDCTLRLKYKLSSLLEQNPKMKQFFDTWVGEFSREALETEREGISVDFALIKDMYQRMEKHCDEVRAQFKKEVNVPDVNMNSTKQLCKIFFDTMNLPVIKKGKTGPSLDEEVILELQSKFPDNKALGLVIIQRGLQKRMSTYLEGIKNAALFGVSKVPNKVKDICWTPEDARALGFTTDGKVHCNYMLHVATTGRLACRNPNLQNITSVTPDDIARNYVIRYCFVAPQGYKFVSADLSQAEVWTLQAESQDLALKAALESERGVHYALASELFGVPVEQVTDEQKRIAKRVVFGISYGQTAMTLAQDLKISTQKADEYIQGWHRKFPAASWWFAQLVEKAKVEKKVTSVFGRVRHLPLIDSPSYAAQQDSEREAKNTPIQGAASDITQIAAVKIRREFNRLGLKSRRVLTIHDDNTYLVPDEELEEVKKIVKENMEAYVPELGIPMKCKLEVSERWNAELDEDMVVPDAK